MIKDLDKKLDSAFWSYRNEYANSGNAYSKNNKKVTPEMKKHLKKLVEVAGDLMKL